MEIQSGKIKKNIRPNFEFFLSIYPIFILILILRPKKSNNKPKPKKKKKKNNNRLPEKDQLLKRKFRSLNLEYLIMELVDDLANWSTVILAYAMVAMVG